MCFEPPLRGETELLRSVGNVLRTVGKARCAWKGGNLLTQGATPSGGHQAAGAAKAGPATRSAGGLSGEEVREGILGFGREQFTFERQCVIGQAHRGERIAAVGYLGKVVAARIGGEAQDVESFAPVPPVLCCEIGALGTAHFPLGINPGFDNALPSLWIHRHLPLVVMPAVANTNCILVTV